MVQLYLLRINKKRVTRTTLEPVQNTQRGQQDGSPLNQPQHNSPKHPQSVGKTTTLKKKPCLLKSGMKHSDKIQPNPNITFSHFSEVLSQPSQNIEIELMQGTASSSMYAAEGQITAQNERTSQTSQPSSSSGREPKRGQE